MVGKTLPGRGEYVTEKGLLDGIVPQRGRENQVFDAMIWLAGKITMRLRLLIDCNGNCQIPMWTR